MSLIWPSRTVSDPSALARLGRLLHWVAALIGAPIFLIGLYRIIAGPEREGFVFNLVLGALIYFAGRGLRFLLAGE